MSKYLLLLAILSFTVVAGCSVEASRKADETGPAAQPQSRVAAAKRGATIDIQPNSPADTVRTFYQRLREKKFREAIFLTNLRPAIEGLTDSELKEFQLDLEAISVQVPEQLEINGEIISGDLATVTAKLPGEDADKLELQEIKLRRENDVWVILTVDEAAEKSIKQEGKNYFYKLRIDTHHEEARKMLDRISKAELAYSMQNGGVYAEMPALIASGFLPEDVQKTDSTGYKYSVKLTDGNKRYSATALPETYGKTGKLSFFVELDEKGLPRLTSADNGGKPMK
jgi:hypothetical protein